MVEDRGRAVTSLECRQCCMRVRVLQHTCCVDGSKCDTTSMGCCWCCVRAVTLFCRLG